MVHVIFLPLFSKSYLSTHAPLSRPLLSGSDNTISYNSHENVYFGKHSFKKWSDKCQSMLNGWYHCNLCNRVFVQSTKIVSICVKNHLDGWIKFTKNKHNTNGVQCINTKKQHLSKVSACWICSLPSWLMVGTGLLVWCSCNNHYYYTGLLQVQRQHRWLEIAITNMDAGPVQVYQTYMLKGTSLQIWLLVRCNCLRHGKLSDEIVTDMADGWVQM